MVIGDSRPSTGRRILTGREVVSRRLSRLDITLDVHVVTDKTRQGLRRGFRR